MGCKKLSEASTTAKQTGRRTRNSLGTAQFRALPGLGKRTERVAEY
jgi:hypothetical protein